MDEQSEERPTLITGEMLAPPVVREERQEFEQGMSYWQPMTLGLMLVLVIIFIWQMATGSLETEESIIRSGALVQDRLLKGELWRLFSAVFLHGSIDHLIGNCMALYVLGMAVEHAFSKLRSLWIFLAAGLGGSLLSASLSEGPSVGASGAIFGLMGSAIVFFYRFRKDFFVREKRLGGVLVVWVLYSVITGFLTPMIDNWAHIGGLIGGALATWALRPQLPMNLPMSSCCRLFWFGVGIALPLGAQASDVKVNNAAELRTAVAVAKPGTRLMLASGNYGAGFHFANLRGEEGRPIVIAAADAQQRPLFGPGNTGLHLSNPAYVELHNLAFTKLAHNGLNIDDGGTATNASARGVVLRGLRISDIGSDGNHDGIKLSGLWDFRVSDCTIERWGTRGGSAIDMVGCHRGIIENNTIRHNVPEPPNCSGVQGKGGTSDIVIRRNRFEHAGGRSVNIGGSTGLKYFRPALAADGEHAEARNLRVEGNTFVGSVVPVAFVGVDGAVVRFNTIERPGRWVLRILQETTALGFVACRNGEFTDNTIVFESARWSEGGVNIGSGTAPETFKFARNWWFCADNPERSRPRLPTPEVDGTYGRAVAEARGKAGAEALPKSTKDQL